MGGIAATTQPVCLSKRQAEQVLQHPLDGPCPKCRVLRNGNGKHAGCWLCETPYGGLLLRRLDSRHHLLRTPPAIAFEEGVWMQVRRNVALIAVVDRASPQVWWTSPAAFENRSIEIDRGGLQIALRLEHWSRAMVVADQQEAVS